MSHFKNAIYTQQALKCVKNKTKIQNPFCHFL